jgi:hypothetical protein
MLGMEQAQAKYLKSLGMGLGNRIAKIIGQGSLRGLLALWCAGSSILDYTQHEPAPSLLSNSLHYESLDARIFACH